MEGHAQTLFTDVLPAQKSFASVPIKLEICWEARRELMRESCFMRGRGQNHGGKGWVSAGAGGGRTPGDGWQRAEEVQLCPRPTPVTTGRF